MMLLISTSLWPQSRDRVTSMCRTEHFLNSVISTISGSDWEMVFRIETKINKRSYPNPLLSLVTFKLAGWLKLEISLQHFNS